MNATINVIYTPRDGVDSVSLGDLGGKAYALYQMQQIIDAAEDRRLYIPGWFAISPAAFATTGLRPESARQIEQAVKSLTKSFSHETGLQEVSDECKLFAVRSSAVDEDGVDSSFAGQLSSFLNIEARDVLSHVNKVYQSAFTDSIIAYRKERGLSERPAAPAVLVQCMVKADTSGVIFSRDPVGMHKNQMVMMATQGLADQLVSGEVNGDTYHVDFDGKLMKSELIEPAAILTPEKCQRVSSLALSCERHFGVPQDVEWAFDGQRLALLQSRPITTLNASHDQENDEQVNGRQADGARNIDDVESSTAGELTIWDNSNIVESYSGVTSPLTFSFASYVYSEVYMAFLAIMGVPEKKIRSRQVVFDNLLGFIHGHVYYNLLNWYRILAMLPGFKTNRNYMEQMMGVAEALPESLVQRILAEDQSERGGISQKVNDTLQLVKAISRMVYHDNRLKRYIAVFYDKLNEALSVPREKLGEMNLTELAAHYRELESKLLSQWHPPLINDFMCMIAFGLSRKMLVKYCGEALGQSLHNEFMIGQGDIISAEPTKRIRQMAELVKDQPEVISKLIQGDEMALDDHADLKVAFGDYLDKFGDRCTQELKLESLTLHEDATTLLQAIGYSAEQIKMRPRSESQTSDSQSESPEKQLADHLSGFNYWLVRRLVSWAKRRVSHRENLRFERTRLFARVRGIFLEMGRRFQAQDILTDARDIFYLQVHEILGAVEGTVTTYDFKRLVTIRQAEAEQFQQRVKDLEMPNRIETHGAALPALVKAMDKMQNPFETETAAEADALKRKGLGCCRGEITAKVRVINDPRAEALLPGEILVARHTDPGWIALFSNAAGIIVERGSLLSHSAIVAREMGIPAIVAISDIMIWVKTGETVTMNGASGLVIKQGPIASLDQVVKVEEPVSA